MIVVILSGGLDSSVMLHWMAKRIGAENIKALSFDYGQRHKVELECAQWQAMSLGVSWDLVDLRNLRALLAPSESALVSDNVEVPEGHYASATMKATVVPNRNMIMLAIATGHALALGANAVAYAAHPGDHAIYPDCRPEFADALAHTISLCDWHHVDLERPFVTEGIDKAKIAALSKELGVDVSKTWSCYVGGETHCGNCGTCVERREAFRLADVEDPTEYGPFAKDLDELLQQKDS